MGDSSPELSERDARLVRSSKIGDQSANRVHWCSMWKHRSSRMSLTCPGTFVLVAFVGACGDGSGGLSAGKGSGNDSSTAGGTSTSAAGTSVLPSAGTAAAEGGNASTSTDTGGAPATTGGTTVGGSTTVVATTAGSSTGGAGGSGGATTTSGLKQGPFKMLVLSTTLEFHHDSIATCLAMLNDLGKAAAPERASISGLAADATWTVDQINPEPGSANYFSEVTADNLAKYEMMYSDNPTGPVFTNAPDGANKKLIFQTWFGNGGAWAGQHSGTDFENNNRWPWWDDNVAGGWFTGHDGDGTPGTLAWQPQYAGHPILKGLPSPWNTSDEWYIMNRDIESVPGFKVLAKVTVSNSSQPNGAQPRPAIWITENAKGGRAFYTIRGHNQKVYAEPEFRQLMLRGILWSVHRLPGGN